MKKDKPFDKSVYRSLIMITQFGINMMVPIVLCVALGAWLGDKYDIDWIVIPLFFMGALAGYTNIYKAAKQFMKEDTNKENDVKKN